MSSTLRRFTLRAGMILALWGSYVGILSGCADGEFFDQFSSASTYSGYIAVASASAVNTAPGAVALFDTNGNFVRALADYYSNAELPAGLAIFGNYVYAIVEGSDRMDQINYKTGSLTSWTYSGLTSTPMRQSVADSSGNIYVVEYNTAQIEKIDYTLTRVGNPFIATSGGCPLAGPWGVAYISSTSQIAVTNSNASTRLNIYDLNGTCITSANNAAFGTTTTGIVYHRQTNKLITVRAGDSSIMYSNVDGTSPGTAYLNASRVGVPYAIAVDGSGYVYVGGTTQDTIEKFNFSGTSLTPAMSGPLIGPNIYTQNPTAIVVVP